MKRFVSLLLSFAIILSLVPVVFAVENIAHSDEYFQYCFDKTTVAPGEQFTLTAYFANDMELGDWDALVDVYPNDVEDKESFEVISLNSDFTPYIYNENSIDVVNDGDYSASRGEVFFACTYRVLDDVAVGSTIDFNVWPCMYGVDKDAFIISITVAESTDDKDTDPVPVDYGYTVSMGADQSAAKGEKVSVPVKIDSTSAIVTKYNAYDMTFSYDTSVLELDMEQTNTAGYRVTPGDGTVRIQRYGEEAAVGEALNLNFVVKTVGTANVTLLSAKVDGRANSIDFDAPAATVTDDGITVVTSTGYSVSLPDDFTTDEDDMVVEPGGSFTFKQVNPSWIYTFSVTMGDTTTENLTFGEDGTYTIENITDNVTVAVESKTPRTFNVTVEGEENVQEGAVQYETTATYMQDYTITITPEHGYVTRVVVKCLDADGTYDQIASKSVKYMDGTNDLVVRGTQITGDLHIVIYKDEATGYTATGVFSYATMNPDPISYYEGDSITFSLEVEPGWEAQNVAARWRTLNKNNGTWIYHSIPATQNEDGTYTIEGLPAYDVEISAASYKPLNWVEVNTYLELDDMTIFLVKVAGKGVEEGYPYAYDGNPMYKTDKYTVEAWEGPVLCWLVSVPKGEEALTAEAAQEKIAYLKTDIIELDQSGDVNMTGKVDINDAQLVYDMYQGAYSDFNTVSVLKFLNADVNSSGTLNSDDAVAIINSMQNN